MNSTNLTLNFKKVCYSCPNREIYVDEDALRSDNKPYILYTNIGCKHEDVCKMYLEEK